MANANISIHLILEIHVPDDLLDKKGGLDEATDEMIGAAIKDSIRKALLNKTNPDREDLGITRIEAVCS